MKRISERIPHHLDDHLRSLGCTSRETAIYLDLYTRGASTVQQIAHRLEENRITVHSAVSKLLERGILSETRQENQRLLVAEEPEIFLSLIRRRKEELEQAEFSAKQAIEIMRALSRETQSTPRFRLRQGVPGLQQMLEESLDATNDIRVITDINEFSRLLGLEYLQSYYARRGQRGIHSRLIWPKTPLLKQLRETLLQNQMNVRILTRDEGWEVGLFSWNDTLAIKSLSQGSVTCTLLESREIAQFFQNVVFESLWQCAREPEIGEYLADSS